jgi:hypothetical protein
VKKCPEKAKEYNVQGMSYNECVEKLISDQNSEIDNYYEKFGCLEYSPCGAALCVDKEKEKNFSCQDDVDTCTGPYSKESEDDDAYWWTCEYADSGG